VEQDGNGRPQSRTQIASEVEWCVGLAMLAYIQNSSCFPCSPWFVHFLEMIEVTEVVLLWQSIFVNKIFMVSAHSL
jgi:hypothetical protein